MKIFSTLFAAAALAYSLAHAADWLCYGGDPGRSGWQRNEKSLNRASVKGLQLLWKRQLGNQSKGLNSLTAPVMLRPIFTHRGVKELVFIAGASDNLYAVDADLGRIFWTRHFDSTASPDQASQWPCGAGLSAAPAIAPPPASASASGDDEPSKTLPPLYVLESDGRLRTLRPSDGHDMAVPLRFIPANANASGLIATGESVSTTTSNGCGGAANGVWTIRASSADAKARFDSAGGDGVFFAWKGRELVVMAGDQGRLTLLDGRRRMLSRSEGGGFTGHLATWEGAAGTRWIYAAKADSVVGFQFAGVELRPAWTFAGIASPLSLVIANGVVYVLAGGNKTTHSTLYALHAATGEQLYSSKDSVTSFTLSGGLAVANGHICFGTADNTLYCFGLPLEI